MKYLVALRRFGPGEAESPHRWVDMSCCCDVARQSHEPRKEFDNPEKSRGHPGVVKRGVKRVVRRDQHRGLVEVWFAECRYKQVSAAEAVTPPTLEPLTSCLHFLNTVISSSLEVGSVGKTEHIVYTSVHSIVIYLGIY